MSEKCGTNCVNPKFCPRHGCIKTDSNAADKYSQLVKAILRDNVEMDEIEKQFGLTP